MSSLANPGNGYTIIPYPSSERGVSLWNIDERVQSLSDNINNAKQRMELQRQAATSFGTGTVKIGTQSVGTQSVATMRPDDLIVKNDKTFNDLFKDDIYGDVRKFEEQVLKNDFTPDFMNGKGYWEGLLHIFVREGIKPQYGFGDNAGKYQTEFMESDIGKSIELDLVRYYNEVRTLKHTKGVKKHFNNAINKIVSGIPEYWRKKAASRVDLGLGGGSKKITTRKYKNRKLSYRRHNKKRTTKNRRRYSRRK